MALVEPVFLLFALISCLFYRIASRGDSLRPLVLVALSLFFYSTWNPWYCLPLTVTALLDYNTSRLLVRMPGGWDCWLSRIKVSRPPRRLFSRTAVSVTRRSLSKVR